MPSLFHAPFCPQSRFIRLVMGEMGMEAELKEERAWERRRDFAAEPGRRDARAGRGGRAGRARRRHHPGVSRRDAGLALGADRLLPEDPRGRIEVRRLTHWFTRKFFSEVSGPLTHEKISKRFMRPEDGGGSPDMQVIRAARGNARYHLQYIGWLTARRNWLAGDRLSYADLAAAAHISCADYLGDVAWEESEGARTWYARMKSRPSFRPLLAERVAGMAPADTYENLDF